MKKVILILAASLVLFSCKDKTKTSSQANSTDSTVHFMSESVNKPIVIDTNSICYQESFVFDILVTHNDGKTETIKGLSEQPNVDECPKGTGVKWCLLDEKTDEVISKDVKSYKVITQRFDSIQYFICYDKKNR
jgi:hypothetical protein